VEVLKILAIIESSPVMQIIMITLLGLFIGSFLNVLNYRLPVMEDFRLAEMIKSNSSEVNKEVNEAYEAGKGMSISFPSSHCTSCKSKIKFYQNIPVFGWIFLRGKCSNCKKSISIEYPFVELTHTLLWVFAYAIFGFTINLLFILPMISLVLVISMIDLRHKIVLGGHTELLAVLGLGYSMFGLSELSPKESFLAGIIIFLVLYVFVVLYEKLRGIGEQMGRGDFYILGACGTWVGVENSFKVVIYASIVGLIGFLIKRIIKSKDKEMPFAPAIIVSFLLVFFEIIPKNLF
jgi:leader peptidase (prepilin peptidase)/N-methyltransferase